MMKKIDNDTVDALSNPICKQLSACSRRSYGAPGWVHTTGVLRGLIRHFETDMAAPGIVVEGLRSIPRRPEWTLKLSDGVYWSVKNVYCLRAENFRPSCRTRIAKA